MPLDVLGRLLRPLRRGTVTSGYPRRRPVVSPVTRGLPELDTVLCDATAACVDACPTSAIRVEDGEWILDAGACIYCGACAKACPVDAIRLGSQIELAVHERDDLLVVRALKVRS